MGSGSIKWKEGFIFLRVFSLSSPVIAALSVVRIAEGVLKSRPWQPVRGKVGVGRTLEASLILFELYGFPFFRVFSHKKLPLHLVEPRWLLQGLSLFRLGTSGSKGNADVVVLWTPGFPPIHCFQVLGGTTPSILWCFIVGLTWEETIILI